MKNIPGPALLKQKAQKVYAENQKLIRKLKKLKPGKVDELVHPLHQEIMDKTDCLQCANCCKSISPILYDKDIERLSRHLQMKPSEFTGKYLDIDEENDYVFKETPCPFLLPDNYCMVYESRPKACREYPHTDRSKFRQILSLSLKNTYVCPIVFDVFEELRNRVK